MKNKIIVLGLLTLACGRNGAHGVNGVDGADGVNAVLLSSKTIAPGECAQIGVGIWAENINKGQLVDIYYNDSCDDKLGEFCDNLLPANGKKGSGTMCWVGNVQISASYGENGAVTVYSLDFNVN